MSTATDAVPDDAQRADVPRCFVIGPIGDKYAERGTEERRLYEESLRVYDEVVRAACQEHQLVPLRADAIADTGEITDQIHQRLQTDDIVIADVSAGNPNVMYELGYRNGTGKPVILIGESGRLPFDIAQLRTIRFRRTESSLHEARDQLSRVLGEGLARGFRAVARTGAAVARQTAAVEGEEEDEDDAPGVVDRLAQAEEEIEYVVHDIEAMGEALHRIAAVAEEQTAEMTGATEGQVPASVRLAVIGRFSKAVAEPAGALRSSSEAFSKRMLVVEGGMHALFDMVESLPPEERDEDSAHFFRQIIELAETTRESTTHIVGFGTVMKTVTGYSRLLRDPGRDVAAAVRTVISVVPRIEALESRAKALLTDAPAPSSGGTEASPPPPPLTHLTAS
ncbi:nucleoside 2-deoxyribosyltransferase [Streptomyces sp. NBC_00708]